MNGLHEDEFVWTKFLGQFHADRGPGLMDFGRHLPVRRLGVLNRPVFFAHKRDHAVQQNAQQHRRRAQGVEVVIPFLFQNGRGFHAEIVCRINTLGRGKLLQGRSSVDDHHLAFGHFLHGIARAFLAKTAVLKAAVGHDLRAPSGAEVDV